MSNSAAFDDKAATNSYVDDLADAIFRACVKSHGIVFAAPTDQMRADTMLSLDGDAGVAFVGESLAGPRV